MQQSIGTYTVIRRQTDWVVAVTAPVVVQLSDDGLLLLLLLQLLLFCHLLLQLLSLLLLLSTVLLECGLSLQNHQSNQSQQRMQQQNHQQQLQQVKWSSREQSRADSQCCACRELDCGRRIVYTQYAMVICARLRVWQLQQLAIASQQPV